MTKMMVPLPYVLGMEGWTDTGYAQHWHHPDNGWLMCIVVSESDDRDALQQRTQETLSAYFRMTVALHLLFKPNKNPSLSAERFFNIGPTWFKSANDAFEPYEFSEPVA